MASEDPNYIQSDEILSDLLSPTNSSISIQSTPVCITQIQLAIGNSKGIATRERSCTE